MPNKVNTPLKDAIVQTKINNPEFTLREIGEKFNLSRERIRQILVSVNMETRSAKRVEIANTPLPICMMPECENRVSHRPRTYCVVCVENGSWKTHMGIRRRRIPQITIQCDYCSKDITMRETLYQRQRSRHKNTFCSQKCRSRHVWHTQKLVENVDGRIVRVLLGR